MTQSDVAPSATVEPARRRAILQAALQSFTRFGYRKTSMDDVARAAAISRPGLYLHFGSKQELFRATVTRALELDLASAQQALADRERPLRDRLTSAFDHWAGRYVGPAAHDLAALVAEHPELVGPEVGAYPQRFADLVTDALRAGCPGAPHGVVDDAAAALLDASAGTKYDAASREEYLARFARTVDVMLRALGSGR